MMPNLQKKRLLIFEIFNIKKCTLFFFFLEPSILTSLSMHPSVQHTPSIHQFNVRSSVHLTICLPTRLFIHPSPIQFCVCKLFHPYNQPVSQPANQPTNQPTKTITGPVKTRYLIAFITLPSPEYSVYLLP